MDLISTAVVISAGDAFAALVFTAVSDLANTAATALTVSDVAALGCTTVSG